MRESFNVDLRNESIKKSGLPLIVKRPQVINDHEFIIFFFVETYMIS